MELQSCGYEPVADIGHGAFAHVYSVVTKDGMKRAFKYVTGDVFPAEIDVARRLKHPNLLHAFEVVTTADCNINGYGLLFTLASSSLRGILKSPYYTINNKIINLQQVTQGLKCLHDHGVLHLDIKEDNILLVGKLSDMNGYTALLGDFGLASYVDSAKEGKAVSGVSGTIVYIAPEALKSQGPFVYNYTLDIWALGITMLNVFSGSCITCPTPPNTLGYITEWFGDNNRRKTIITVLKDSRVIGIPGLVDLLDGMLNINPNKRPNTTQILNSRLFAGLDVVVGTSIAFKRVINVPRAKELRNSVINILQNAKIDYHAAVVFLALDLVYACSNINMDNKNININSVSEISSSCLRIAISLITGVPIARNSQSLKIISFLKGILYPNNPYTVAQSKREVITGFMELSMKPEMYGVNLKVWRSKLQREEFPQPKDAITSKQLIGLVV